MKSGWTGGQYSVFRALLGAYLAVHFAMLLPWGAEVFSSQGMLADGRASPLLGVFPNVFALSDAPWFVTAVLALATAGSVAFAAGRRDRIAAVLVWYLGACLLGRNPLISNPGLPYVGWLLLVHACLPPAPYGSWDARGRADPRGGWGMPRLAWGGAWALMAAGYTFSGVAKLGSPSWTDGTAFTRVLENPLARPTFLRDAMLALPESLLAAATYGALAAEIAFLPFALFRRTRPWAWTALLLMHFGLMTLLDFTDLSLGMVFLHLFTFDPEWLAPRAAPAPDTVYYDGSCGLCHRTVRFVIAEDRTSAFTFAPLEGDAFLAEVGEAQRSALPDSVVVRTADGRLLVRSAAIIHLLDRLGGAWRALAAVLRAVPRPVRDFGYDGVASVRRRVFAAPGGACPVLPADVRGRFR